MYGAATFELAVYALLVALVVGVPLGAIAARKRDRMPDIVLRVLAILSYATPSSSPGSCSSSSSASSSTWCPRRAARAPGRS